MSENKTLSEKKTLSIEEIEAQSALELPDRQVMATVRNFVANAYNFCPAYAFNAFTAFSFAAATPVCTAGAASGGS